MQITVFIAALLLLGAGTYLSFHGLIGAATVTYGTAVLCLIFSFLSEFKTFKGLGIEAELFDRKIAEADKLLSQLRDICTPIAEMLFTTASRMGRWGSSIPRYQRYELMQKIEAELKKCGVSPAQLESAKSDWHYFNVFDLASPVFQKVYNSLNEKLIEEDRKIQTFTQPIPPENKFAYEQLLENRRSHGKELSRLQETQQLKEYSQLHEKIRKIVTSSELLNQEEKTSLLNDIDEELKDVEHYVVNKEFRRLQIWLSEQK